MMIQNRTTFETVDELSIWLEPGNEDQKRISDVILDTSNKAKTEIFAPHVTLISNLPFSAKEALVYLEKLGANVSPFQIEFRSLSFGDNPLKTFFLECTPSEPLLKLNKLAQKRAPTKYEYQPHLSLLYGDISMVKKESLAKKIKKHNLSYFSFTPKILSLWWAKGSPNHWQRLAAVQIKNN